MKNKCLTIKETNRLYNLMNHTEKSTLENILYVAAWDLRRKYAVSEEEIIDQALNGFNGS